MKTETQKQLTDVAKECAGVYDRCAAADPDLFGGSLLDLCADNIERVSLADLKAAIVVAGIYERATTRIRRQIADYSRVSSLPAHGFGGHAVSGGDI